MVSEKCPHLASETALSTESSSAVYSASWLSIGVTKLHSRLLQPINTTTIRSPMYKIRFTPAKIQLFIAQLIDIYIRFSPSRGGAASLRGSLSPICPICPTVVIPKSRKHASPSPEGGATTLTRCKPRAASGYSQLSTLHFPLSKGGQGGLTLNSKLSTLNYSKLSTVSKL